MDKYSTTELQKKAQVMTDCMIYDEWTNFVSDEKYIKYFTSNEANWRQKLDEVMRYMDENGKKPSAIDKNIKIKYLGTWVGTQQNNYQNKAKIMKNESIYDEWTEFVSDEKYIKYFTSNEDNWRHKYKCDNCDKNFNLNKNLKYHIENNSCKICNFECKYCHIRFTTSTSMYRHIRLSCNGKKKKK